MTIEFLSSDGPDAGPGEPAGQVGRRRRKLWWLVVALLLAGATTWVSTRPASSPPTSPPSSPASSRPSPPARIAARSSLAPPRRDPECRHVPDCSVRTDVPAAIGRLVRAYLPAGVQVRVRTVVAVGSLTLRNELVARDIDATGNSVSVLVRVRRGGPGRAPIVPDPLGVGSLLLHGVNAGYVVRLQYLAPETVPPMLDRLRALIRDPRLTAGPG